METIKELGRQLVDRKSYEKLFDDRCFQRSYTWAGVPAVLMFFHKVKTYRGYVVRATWWGAGTFAAVAFVSFNICVSEERQKLAVLRMNRMKHISEAPDAVKKTMMPRAPSSNSSDSNTPTDP